MRKPDPKPAPTPAGLAIRPYALENVRALVEAARESWREVQPFGPWCRPDFSAEDARMWIESQIAAFRNGSAFEFAVLSPEGELLGGCGVNSVEWVNRRANLGYWTRSSMTGRGIATAAIRLVVDWAFAETNLNRLELVVSDRNPRSLRVAERSGAVREGLLRERLFLEGEPHDAVIFSFVRRDFIRGDRDDDSAGAAAGLLPDVLPGAGS